MILIADSGSTKTDWALVEGPEAMLRVASQGINPVLMPEEMVTTVLNTEVLPQLEKHLTSITEVFFYGAGAAGEAAQRLRGVLLRSFPTAKRCEVMSDLLAAARCSLQHSEGIAAILGTGSNSCCYADGQIIANTPSLGYVLGDEGGGVHIGKSLLCGVLKGWLPKAVCDDFRAEYGLGPAEVIEHVYRQPMPNRYIASFTRFVSKHISVPEVRAMVAECFDLFIQHNIAPYGKAGVEVHFVGSIAGVFSDILEESLERNGYVLGGIHAAPMSGLIEYHAAV